MIDSAKIELRNLSIKDYKELKISMMESYGSLADEYWSEKEIKNLIKKFPEGQFCIIIDEKIAGCALSIIVDYNKFDDNHTYEAITGGENFSTHTKNGMCCMGSMSLFTPNIAGCVLGDGFMRPERSFVSS